MDSNRNGTSLAMGMYSLQMASRGTSLRGTFFYANTSYSI